MTDVSHSQNESHVSDNQLSILNKITLDISNKESNNEFEYSRNIGTYNETYKAKHQFKFEKVVDQSNVLWSSIDGKLIDEVKIEYSVKDGKNQVSYYLKGGEDTLILIKDVRSSSQPGTSIEDHSSTSNEFSQGLTPHTHSSVSGEDSYSLSSSVPGAVAFSSETGTISTNNLPLSIDNNNKDLTGDFEYSRNPTTNVDTYTHKSGFEFRNLNRNELVLDRSDSIYSSKFDPDFSHLRKVMLSLDYDSFRSCKHTVNYPNSDSLKILTLKDDGTFSENDASKYETDDGKFLFLVKFNDGVKCIEVKYDLESVWKYDEVTHGDIYPSTVTLNKINKLISVDSSSYQFCYSYYNNKWNSVSTYKPDLSEQTTKEDSLESFDTYFYSETQVEKLVKLAKHPLGKITYSKVKETNQNKDESDIYVADRDHPLVPKSLYYVPYLLNSAFDVLAESAIFYKDQPHLGKRKKTPKEDGTFELGEFEFSTYEESFKLAKAIGAALTFANLVPETKIYNCKIIKKARFLGIWARNCPYWLLTDYACTGYGFVTVPIYETLGDEALHNILQTTKMETICIDSNKISELEKLKPNCNIKTVIVFDSLTNDDKSKLDKLGIKYHLMDDLINKYKDIPHNPPRTRRTDICTIIYTSGTSANPKGAVYTNEHFVTITERYGNIQNRANIRFGLSMLSFLPLSHVYERSIQHIFPVLAGTIGYYSGDVKNLMDDFQKFKPTFFLGVPRVYTKILGKVREQISNRNIIARSLINWCLKKKKEKFRMNPLNHKNRFYDWFLGKISSKVGGKLEIIISGSAAITSDDVCDIQSFLLTPMIEGWGTTEVGVCMLQDYRDTEKGTIGGPLYGVEFKLRSVPELQYDARGTPPRGELLVKAPGMMLGYFADDNITKQNLDKDGWFRSGDIAELLPNMGLKIIDRIQNIAKLSQGDFIPTEKLENAYVSSKYVEQLYIHVDSTKDHIVGIVVVSKEHVEKWANNNSLKGKEVKDLLNNRDLKKAVQEDFNKIAESQNFNSLEKLKVFTLVDEPFNVNNRMLTPTFKNVRPKIKENYKDVIEKMYCVSQ